MRISQTIRAKIKLEKLFRIYATFSVAFLLSYCISGTVSPISNSSATTCENGMVSGTDDVCGSDSTDVNVSIEGAWTVAVSSSGILNVDITPSSSGTTSLATDNVNIYTNTPNGYQLYLNSTTGSTDIYNNTDTEHERNHFIATTGTKDSPITLSSNSWGYSLATNPTTFSKVETSSSTADSLIRTTTTKTSGFGDNLDVTYGFNADTKLTPGTYTTSVTYTAVAEVPSYTLSSISPNRPAYNASNIPVTIVTTTPASELGLGDITAKIGTVDLTNCSETVVNGYRGATCTYPGGLSAGRYNVGLTSSWHSATYTLNNAFTINSMQEFTNTNCTNLPESTTTLDNRIGLVDSRDGKTYKVSKLADGNCWMVSNLALDGGRTLHPSDSNVTQDRTIPASANITDGTTALTDEPQIYTNSASLTDTYGSTYGNMYNWNAATATLSKFSAGVTVYSESICPKGWKLPNGTNSNTKAYHSLFSTYGYSHGSSDATYSSKVQQAPLFFPFAGFYDANMKQYRAYDKTGFYGTNKSSYYGSNLYVQIFYFDKTAFYEPGVGGSDEENGIAVRCVFGS